MDWSYGVTTVPERIDNLLQRTLKSLAAGGFPNPRLFIDGLDVPPSSLSAYQCSCRNPRIRTAANWVLSAYELYLYNPHATYYAIFQDDFVTYRNVRDYIESCKYPQRGYLNLYTFPENARLNRARWYESNQRGKGAVALVFNRDALQTLLGSRYLVDRAMSVERGYKSIDGGIVSAMKHAGWKEYVHSPSLVQHTGEVSSMGNGKHPLAPYFNGEDFDARELIIK